jgi:hypothetical protein
LQQFFGPQLGTGMLQEIEIQFFVIGMIYLLKCFPVSLF